MKRRTLSHRPTKFTRLLAKLLSVFAWPSMPNLSVLKRCVPKTLAFAFGLRLRSKTRCFTTRVLGRRLPDGKPQERLRFRYLRSKTLAFKKSIAIGFLRFKDFPRRQGLRSGPLRSKNSALCVCVLKPTKCPMSAFWSKVRMFWCLFSWIFPCLYSNEIPLEESHPK